LSQFPTQLGVTYTEVEAKPTVSRNGERTISASALWRDGFGGSTEEIIQLDMLAAASLVTQLLDAIETHYFDSITPKAPSEVL
jgi:hypothetical protein